MAIVVMALTLYPYIFALVRASIAEQSFCVWQAGRTLGCGPWRNFWLVGLPLLRPALVVGVVLVVMETLNDFGVVSAFGLPTLTSGIYNVWLNMHSLSVAVRLALVLLALVFLVLLIERFARGNKRYHTVSSSHRSIVREPLSRVRGALSFCLCAGLVLFGFVLPLGVLAVLTLRHQHQALAEGFLAYGVNSLALSGFSAAFAVVLGFLLAWAARPPAGWFFRSLMRLSSIGYAIPGAVLAIGLAVVAIIGGQGTAYWLIVVRVSGCAFLMGWLVGGTGLWLCGAFHGSALWRGGLRLKPSYALDGTSRSHVGRITLGCYAPHTSAHDATQLNGCRTSGVCR